MQGFFRILPTRPGEDLPPQRRLRVFRIVVLVHVLYILGIVIRAVSSFIERFNSAKLYLDLMVPWWSAMVSGMFQSMVMYLILEMMEASEARQCLQLKANAMIIEKREWELPYVLYLGLLGGLGFLQWISVSMMIDWKVYHTSLSDAIFLFLSMWCVGEMLRFMNRQRAYASLAGQQGKIYSLTPWLLAIPVTYGFVSRLTENTLINEMIGCAIAMILLTSSYWPHAGSIHLFLNIQGYSFNMLYYVAYLPLLWALAMIYKADRYSIGIATAQWTPRKRRLMLGAAILLACIWPSLPRWFMPALAGPRRPAATLTALQFCLLACAWLIFTALAVGEFWTWGAWRWRLMFTPFSALGTIHYPFWLCGALYELTLLWNPAQSRALSH